MPPQILIVEDELILAKDLALTLESLGYEISGVTTSGEDAVSMAERSRPDLALMDIRLTGEIDGITAADLLRSNFDVPVVYLTGYAENDVLERAKRTEPYGYLAKPATLLELRSTIETALYKHQADNRVRESEARYRLLFESANDMIFINSLDEEDSPGTFTDVNDVACEVLGYTKEVLLKTSPLDIMSATDRERIPDELRRLLKGETLMLEKTLSTKRGTGVPVEIHASVLNRGTKPIVMSIARDITERRKAEEALRASEEKYRGMIKNLRDIFYQTDDKGVLTQVSTSVERGLGYTADEIVGRNIVDLYVEKKEREKLIQILLAHGAADQFEARLRRKDGQVRWFSTTASVRRDEAGNFAGVEGIARDVTDRKRGEEALKKSERRFRDLFEHVALVAVELDAQFNVRFANTSFFDLTGWTADELIGRNWFDTCVSTE
jgi:PAS domain S-box-containing protein